MLVLAVLACLLVTAKGAHAQQPPADSLVQAPELKAPERASLVGSYASTAFTAGDVARGAFALPLGLAAPQDRGPLLTNVFPSYSPENAISEWGMGWTVSLAVVRSAVVGDISYDADEFTSPLGRLLKGDDGFYYPLGLATNARFQRQDDRFTGFMPDGSRMVFGGANRVATARGTYAWYLSEVVSSVGRSTRLSYKRNGSGRLYLAHVEYGGASASPEYRIDFEYEGFEPTFEDFRSGQAVVLDRRIRRVTMTARRSDTGAFEERWHYDLTYRGEGLPAFYLASVQQVFRSGESAPRQSFDYNMAIDRVGTSRFERNTSLGEALSRLGRDGFQPNRSAFLDLDEDGRVDIEAGRDNALYLRTDAGFSVQSLPQPTSDAYSKCRRPANPDNAPRTLAQVLGTSTYYVAYAEATPDRLSSTIDVCSREGKRLWSQTLAGDWQLSSTVRLADLDRDRRPEIVRVSAGRYQVLPNTSAADSASFGAAREGALEPSFTPDTAWVHDFNGDSIPDLVARYSGGLIVWSGKGHLEFEQKGRRVELWNKAGPLGSITGYDVTFLDANKDGLADVLLTTPTRNGAFLFVNEGHKAGEDQPVILRERDVAGLREVDPYTSRPMALDLAGTGETTVVYTRGAVGFTVVLAGAETGLMKSADDGRGTVLRFQYGRSRPVPGARDRQAVLDRLVVESTGYDDVAYEYQYSEPRLHSRGKFLLGFNGVTRVSPLAEEIVQFINDDHYSAILTSGAYRDALVPSVYKWEARKYEEATFKGIPWKRLTEQTEGWRSAGANGPDGPAERTVYRTYVDDVCPATVEKTTSVGTLITTTEYGHPAGLSNSMTCLATVVVQDGRHADAQLDFHHEARLGRNDVGLVTAVSRVADGKALTLQTVDYDARWRIKALRRPGAGATRLTWDDRRNLLCVVLSPDRSAVAVSKRDGVTDVILALRTTHGGLAHNQFFSFDGQERLKAAWDDVGSGSESNPDLIYTYRYATATHPGAVSSSLLVDATSGSRRDVVDLWTAAGEPLGTATRQANTWAFGDLVARSRTTGETTHRFRPAIPATGNPMELGLTELFGGTSPTDATWPVTRETKGVFGVATQRSEIVQAGILRNTRETLDVGPGSELIKTLRENDDFETVTATDAAGQVLSFRDQAGATYSYTYDVLGRLRGIVLPDGKRHVVQYDGNGRTSRVGRTEVGAIEYAYSDQTGLLAEKRYLSISAGVRRTMALTYDAAGRVIEEKYRDLESGATRRYKYLWDGATPKAPGQRTALGLLTGVVGDDYAKELSYYSDGKPRRSSLSIDSWRRIETSFRYSDAGDVVERSTNISSLGPGGHVLETALEQNFFDSQGRLERVMRNRASLAELGYNNDGLPTEARLPGEAVARTVYDSLTRRQIGATMRMPGTDAAVVRSYNKRAFAESDDFSIGRLRLHRNYGYSAQGFLLSAHDEQHAYDYRYDLTGMPTSIAEDGVIRELKRTGDVLLAGDVEYRFDDLGRVVQRGDLSLKYGPDGQISTAQRGEGAWTFAHDERGHRLLKRTQGKPVAAYLERGYLDENGLMETFTFAGRPVALLTSIGVSPLVTDFIGTVIAEKDGHPQLPSPYGQRRIHLASSAIVDFAAKGFDGDLGVLRMGVRDYDPYATQWLTPDPLYLEQPNKGIASPVQLNLYSYAAGDPLSFRDPSGKAAEGADALGTSKGDMLHEFERTFDQQKARERWLLEDLRQIERTQGELSMATTAAVRDMDEHMSDYWLSLPGLIPVVVPLAKALQLTVTAATFVIDPFVGPKGVGADDVALAAAGEAADRMRDGSLSGGWSSIGKATGAALGKLLPLVGSGKEVLGFFSRKDDLESMQRSSAALSRQFDATRADLEQVRANEEDLRHWMLHLSEYPGK
jgi:RHS repeat-associated protein